MMLLSFLLFLAAYGIIGASMIHWAMLPGGLKQAVREAGSRFPTPFKIALVLWLLAWVPGIIHAIRT